MSEAQKLIYAVIGAFVIGFLVVGVSKEKPTAAQMEAASMVRNYVAMQEMANDKCTKLVTEKAGEQVYFPSETLSDKESYITLKWVGDGPKSKFKTASCTLHSSIGGISELIIDDKVLIQKKIAAPH